MTVVMNGPGEGEAFSAGPYRFRILEDGAATGGRLGIVEFTLPPAHPSPAQHIHREHDESFLVVIGTVRFTSGTEILDAPAGSLVTVPTGAPHTFQNLDREQQATLLCTVVPERYIGFFRELAALAADIGGDPDSAQTFAIMQRYATEPYQTTS